MKDVIIDKKHYNNRRNDIVYDYTVTQWLLFFFIYCFLGWIWESCYVSIKERQWINRGFMHGPMLPIYGSGAIIVLLATIPVKENLFLVFLFGMIAATILEYITGAVMEQLFHVRYWDYSKNPYNLNGYICIKTSIAWGVFSILMIRVLHRPIDYFVLMIPKNIVDILAFAITIAVAVDFTQSFNEAMDLKEVLTNMSANNKELKRIERRLDVVIAILDNDKKELFLKAGEQKRILQEKFDALERFSKDQKEKMEKNPISKKHRFDWDLEQENQRRSTILSLLSKKATTYLEEFSQYYNEKRRAGIEDREKENLLEELSSLKESLLKQKGDTEDKKQKRYLHSIRLLRRNPNATSPKYKKALEEIESSNKKE